MGPVPSRGGMDRRSFLKKASLAGISGLLLPHAMRSASLSANSRVVILVDPAATTGTTINGSVVQAMVTSGIKSLGQMASVGESWKVLLPGVNLLSKVGIKVSCINTSLPSHPAVAYAIANTLKQMSFSGTPFPENNIIIYDRWTSELRDAGYTINTGTSGVRCIPTEAAGVGYSTATYDVAGSPQRVSRIVTDTIDFLINLAVLKNHTGAGVTLCLKNHFGTVDNPNGLHGNLCNPYAAALSNVAPIKAKQKVCIIDGLYGISNAGPNGPPQFAANTLVMSNDIVATDYWGRKILADRGCWTINDAGHIDAAATTYGLGTNNPALMDVVRIDSPSDIGLDRTPVPHQMQLYQNYPNPFNPFTHIRFDLDRTRHVRLQVFDVTGSAVATLIDGQMAGGEHTVMFDAHGLASGLYVSELAAGELRFTQKMVLLK